MSAQSPYSIENDVDRKVDDAIETFLRSLSQVGPELLSGCLTLSFFERRASRQLFGLVSHEEKVIWEQWILRVVVNNTPRPLGNDSAAVIERQRIQVGWIHYDVAFIWRRTIDGIHILTLAQDTADGMLRTTLSKVFELAAGSL